jgi:hypothetical protein
MDAILLVLFIALGVAAYLYVFKPQIVTSTAPTSTEMDTPTSICPGQETLVSTNPSTGSTYAEYALNGVGNTSPQSPIRLHIGQAIAF